MPTAPELEMPFSVVSREQLERLFGPFLRVSRVGLAVSGGSDSIAMMHLFHDWVNAGEERPHGVVFSVDHGLRAESAQEAQQVVSWARELGFEAEALTWAHGPVLGDIQGRAREARYQLLSQAAKRHGLDVVLMAHTQTDVAETFLMRLARGSGLYGLAAMCSERVVDGVRFVRPLINVPRGVLQHVVARRNAPWIEDPSNANARFLRVQMRQYLPDLAALGLTADRLSSAASALAEARAVVEEVVDALDARAVTSGLGWCSVNLEALAQARTMVAHALLSRLILDVSPQDYAPSYDALEALLSEAQRGDFPTATLAGVIFSVKDRHLELVREAGRGGFPVEPVHGPGTFVWDERFEIHVAEITEDTIIAGLDATARRILEEHRIELSARQAASLPGLRTSSGWAALPLLGSEAAVPALRLKPVRTRFALNS